MKTYFLYILYGINLYILFSLFNINKRIILFKHPNIVKTKNNQYYMKINGKKIYLKKELVK